MAEQPQTPPPLDQPTGQLSAYLADRDEPCPACNYNLRGLQTDRCPECNRELVLQLRLAEPRMGAWIAAIAASAAMLGFNGLLVVYFLLWRAGRSSSGRDLNGVASLVLSALLAGLILHLLIRRRREFGNLPVPTRMGLAFGAWLLTVASAFSFFALIGS
jgi:hypothetical protein